MDDKVLKGSQWAKGPTGPVWDVVEFPTHGTVTLAYWRDTGDGLEQETLTLTRESLLSGDGGWRRSERIREIEQESKATHKARKTDDGGKARPDIGEATRVMTILGQLALPPDQFVVAGSGSMVLRGIKREKPMGDLDLFVTTRLWLHLQAATGPGPYEPLFHVLSPTPGEPGQCDPPWLRRTIEGLIVDVFHDYRYYGMPPIDTALWIKNAEYVGGVPCAKLEFLLDWKLRAGRDKDLSDIRLLRERLGVLA
jgi:hypothetical protein